MDIISFLKSRRTCRKFRQEPLTDAEINIILEAARLASSSVNRQELRYITIQQPHALTQIHPLVHWAALLPPEQGTPQADQLPVLYIAVLTPSQSAATQEVNIGLAMGNMTAAAWSQGIGSCILGSIHRSELARILEVPPEYKISYLIAFGHSAQHSRVIDAVSESTPYSIDADGNLIVPKLPLSKIVIKKI